MQIRAFLAADDAVSPVIAVILMVAITVVLAAVVALFAGGFGQEVANSEGPDRTAFEYDFTDYDDTREDEFVVTLTAGQIAQDKRDIYIVSTHGFEDDRLADTDFECAREFVCPVDFDDETGVDGDTMDAGESYQIFALKPDTPFEEATVRLVYRSPQGDTSRTLARWEGPQA